MFSLPEEHGLLVLAIITIGLGVLVLVPCVVIAIGVVFELFRRRTTVESSVTDIHAHVLYEPNLGLTMADGGEKVDEND